MDLLSIDEGNLALKAARIYVDAIVSKIPVTETILPESFTEKRGCFVTLSISGELRGCIGVPYPVLSLSEALKDAAESAAVRDPRFKPVSQAELAGIKVEVTVLTPPQELSCPAAERANAVEVGRHGLIAKSKSRSGLLLPQVAAEYGWSAEEFLSHTCIKAGLSALAWKSEECSIQTFEGQIFTEQ